MLRPTVSREVNLGVKHPSEAYTRFLLLSDSCGFGDVGRPLRRKDDSVVYSCCWSFSDLIPAGLMTTLYCLRFEGGLGPRIYIHQEEGCPVTPPNHWVPFLSAPTACRATAELFDPDSTRGPAGLRYIALAQTSQKTPLRTTPLLLRACLLRQLPSKRGCLQGRSLVTAVSACFIVLACSRYATIY
jgi:hypothetical protein